MKKCEDIVPNFGENRPGFFTMTTHRLTLPSSPTGFWRKTKLLLSPDLAPCDFFLFPKMKLKLKGRRFDTSEEIQAETQKVLDTLTEKDFMKRFKNGGDSGTGVYMWEGTTSRVTATDRSYDKFYDFYSVSPENFGSTLVYAGKYKLLISLTL